MLVIGIALFFCFRFTLKIARARKVFTNIFPTRNCQTFINSYGDYFEEYAIRDFDYIIANKDAQSSGCLQCFCTEQKEKQGYDKK